jgi:diacylglycerol kinase
MFVLCAYVMYQALWVSKMEHQRALMYGLCGGLAIAEVFLVLTFFPTGIYVNAALTALAAYAFLGLSRAWFLEQTHRRLITRYVVVIVAFAALLLLTAQWL